MIIQNFILTLQRQTNSKKSHKVCGLFGCKFNTLIVIIVIILR